MLSTKLNDSMMLNIPLSETLSICRKVVADLGWRVLEQDQTRLRCKEVAVSGTSFNWPAEVELILSSLNQSQTSIYLNGSIFGFGPIQKGHLQGQLGNLRNRIEIAVQEKTDEQQRHIGSTGGSLGAELEKLASLHKQGILTDEEFQMAKKRLLEN